MQYDPHKQGYNNYGNVYGNQYPPMNQTPYGVGNMYPPNNAPPPYTQYPQHPSAYPTSGAPYNSSTPCYQSQTGAVAPVYRPSWNNLIPTSITSSLRVFFVISGILYLIWGVLVVGFEIGIIYYSYWRYYTGFWTGCFFISGGISMLVVACKTSYVMAHLIRLFAICLFLGILGLILSIVNVARYKSCDSVYYWQYCNNSTGHHLKIAILVFIIIALIHTIINIVVTSNARKSTTSACTSSIPTQ
ncbi:unnamed protein product [Rotaria sp. Silwood2]|nr:unnamed protein product [Rotaria sp. Silwood2]CAF3067228.1 unnamed protein product [Rotaria sp. Silwood2]CAF3194111.1 unnamed protein product [Rotaria sp. Silwood2]CAF3318054.1 unnamed protein product [Rotaria sp. Silwood2]CAF4059785.1 unnamed protein product [Rotaria sp. Silwood2]